jgi:cation diffusion facilitator family transporter
VGYRRPEADGEPSARTRRIRRVLWTILVLNLGVASAKLVWGVVSGSTAMQADGFHSLFDGASNAIGLVGMALAMRPADRDHPYGHAKYETYASAAIAGMLVFAAYRIGSTAIAQLTTETPAIRVDAISFAVMLVTLAINLFITFWERRVGRRLKSEILIADASHTASDVIVSIGVILSLVLVRAGMAWADPLVALLVAGAIAWTAWKIFLTASATLSDTSRIPAADICEVAMSSPGVLGCHHVRTRGSEAQVYVDLHIQVDESRSVGDGHRIAEEVERLICHRFSNVVDTIVHLEPYDTYQADKTAREVDEGLA